MAVLWVVVIDFSNNCHREDVCFEGKVTPSLPIPFGSPCHGTDRLAQCWGSQLSEALDDTAPQAVDRKTCLANQYNKSLRSMVAQAGAECGMHCGSGWQGLVHLIGTVQGSLSFWNWLERFRGRAVFMLWSSRLRFSLHFPTVSLSLSLSLSGPAFVASVPIDPRSKEKEGKSGAQLLTESMEHREETVTEESRSSEDDIDGNHTFSMKKFLWHGGSVYDAWFTCASNQVAQVLLSLPYSFSQLGMVSGVLLQIFYGIMGSWTAYLISVLYLEYRSRIEKQANAISKNHVIQWFEVLGGLLGSYWKAIGLAFNCTYLLFGAVIQLIACASNIYYINDRLDKRTWTYIFGACCATTVFIPSYHNYRIWSFLGLGMTTYTAWYLTIAALIHGQVPGVTHSGPTKLVLYFTGATNILYTFGGHAITVEIIHAMWKPRKFKYVYLLATLYVFTLTIPSAAVMYWAFGDQLLANANAFSLLPRSGFRDTAVILMLIHQFITFGFASTPLYFVWEKLIGVHGTTNIGLQAVARLPVLIPIWFLAIIFPFFGPINSAVGALLVTFTVYIIPALAHMLTYRTASARQNAVEKPPFFLPSWRGIFAVNALVVAWVLVFGFGFGGWASITNFVNQVHTFGLFAKCYQCAKTPAPQRQH